MAVALRRAQTLMPSKLMPNRMACELTCGPTVCQWESPEDVLNNAMTERAVQG